MLHVERKWNVTCLKWKWNIGLETYNNNVYTHEWEMSTESRIYSKK